ncbi:MAG TPA: hypothetical protein VG713_11020, partial [Pirellulales bacterium]|nr:hypothetical protein [Pirellulales bacterium]
MAIEPTAADSSGRSSGVDRVPPRGKPRPPIAPPRQVVRAEVAAPPVSVEIAQPAPPPELVPKATAAFEFAQHRAAQPAPTPENRSLAARWQRWALRHRLATSFTTSAFVHF